MITERTPVVVDPVSSCATSKAAQYVTAEWDENRKRLRESVYFGLDARWVWTEPAVNVYEQHQKENWDGYVPHR